MGHQKLKVDFMKLRFKVIFYGMMSTILLSACMTKNIDDTHWKETYATLYRNGVGRGAEHMIYYWVDGKMYETDGSFDAYGYVLGDKYLIKYNPSNPEQIKEYTWVLVFTESEKTIECIGEIKKVFWFGPGRHAITFQYTVEGKTYERTQDLPPDYKEQYPDLKKGQKYKVVCWDKNPQRSVLCFSEAR
jgi:hypothetical protein